MTSVLIIAAESYQNITEMLVEGAIEYLKKQENIKYDIIKVPGEFEIPAAISMVLASKYKYDGFITLGCVVRGETSHYDYITEESAKGINEIAIKNNIPIGYGIITVENEAQALMRVDKGKKDKGGWAANSCIAMINLKRKLELI
ncbi:MAG: 6,7-dimethyl-8-ribityllumazine synthase [Sphingobacteriia bacterium]|nr:6,7-dimethyl-8-ribityllumazine synthase [Sphingobacteriia bacterium]